MKGWHFVGKKLRNGDPVPRVGKKLVYTGALKLCSSGLHWSPTPFEALEYAPGATLCYVEVGGNTLYTKGDDKGCSSERTIIAKMDATELLLYFARQQALSVVHLWDAPDVVLDYLMTGDESQRAAAWAAACDAACDAARARAAAWAAACDAAWAAACDAARARAAAWAAARDAAWAAARDAARAAAKKEFNQLVYECFEDFL